MSILDDTKRAQKGAKTLLKLITESTPDTFERMMDEYIGQDGIIGTDFLATLDKAKKVLPKFDDSEGEKDFFDFPIEFQMAFLERLIQIEKYDLLQSLMDKTKEKSIKKILKRRIHELKSKGITFSAPKKKGGFKFKSVVEPEPDTIVSESNSMGEREIFYAARSPRSGVRLLYGVSHYSDGITEFDFFETSRSGLRDMIKSLRTDSNLEIFQVAQPIGYYLLESAKKRNEQSGRPIPQRFMTAFQEFPRPVDSPSKSPIYNYVSAKDIEKRFSDVMKSDQLHKNVEFKNWILPGDILQQMEHRYSEIQYSTVLVDDAQKEDQINNLVIDTIDQFFVEKIREEWISRLEDSSLILYLNNMKDQALLALTVAEALKQQSRPASSIPFCESLLTKLIRKPQSSQEDRAKVDETGTEKGKIILP